jgi:hypothetical protein
VRSQVFEVVVRQAIAGAPWREICAGPMQVNNITPEEVQNEIDRRVKMMKDSAPELVVPPKQPEETSIAVDKGLATCLEHFEKTLLECFQKIQAGEMPDADALEKARTDLIAVLAKSPIASSVPLLQKYLRSDLIKLIAAIGGADAVNKQLKTLAAAQQENFESLRSEITGVLKTPSKQPL